MRQILNLSQWETRVADVHSMARLCRMTSAELQDRVKAQIWDELNRKHGKRAVYSAYVHGYVSGLLAAERSRLYR